MTESRSGESAARPPDGSLEAAVLRRLEDFERENQRLRRLGIYVLGVVGALLGLAAAFVVVAARHGMPGFVPLVTESRRFVVRDTEGRVRATLGTNTEGSSQFMLQDEAGHERLRMSVLPDGGAGVAFVDSTGRSRMVLGLLPDQSASVVLADGGGKTRTVLNLSPNGASTILFADKGGTARAGLGVDARGVGTFTLVDRSGSDLSGASESAPEPQPEPPAPAPATRSPFQEALTPMRILVTGGAGFIGSHLCDRLLGEGHDVICLDNFFTGRRENIEHLLDHPHFEELRHDVCEPLFTEVEQIYNPVKTVKSNVMGTLNMLVLAKRVRARILQASTSEVYGDPTVHPQTESYWGNVNPIGPRACYDEGKRVAETLMSDYHREDGVNIRIARIFNTYGPRMAENDGRVVSNFIVQAIRGQELTLYGTGQQTRSFCYVDDLVEGLVRLMNSEDRPDPVNLGNPVEFTIRELAEQVVRVVGGETRVTYKPLPQDDPTQRQPDITRAREWLAWEPKVPLIDGLEQTVAYFRQRLSRRARASLPPLDETVTSPRMMD